MNTLRQVALLLSVITFAVAGFSQDSTKLIRKAAERSTLNQDGTKPFHLKATVAPTYERDAGTERTGTVELWWESPTRWKREVRSPEFHQIAIMNDGHEWQNNEGDYFPEWLREIAVALIEPLPSLDQVLQQAEGAEIKRLAGTTFFSWTEVSSDGKVQKGTGAGIAVTDKTGLLAYGRGTGWSFLYGEYANFHGKHVARKVSSGSPEVTAVVEKLEDLGRGFELFAIPTGGSSLVKTAIVEETALRKNLLPSHPPAWPLLQDGPLEGVFSTEVVIDRTGVVREVGTIVSDNPGIGEAAKEYISGLRFTPYEEHGIPVQVVSRFTMAFQSERPGMHFDSARTYFERGRELSFPAAAANGSPYVLKATFILRSKSGKLEEGQYTDTWKSANEWRREAVVGRSRYVRAQRGEKRYQDGAGGEQGLLRFVVKALEPIPAIDGFVESDWRIQRDGDTMRVLSGYESPEGKLDEERARGYWFDDSGRLVKTHFQGIETRRLEFQLFENSQVAHRIEVRRDGVVDMVIQVADVSSANSIDESLFEVHGHEWTRAFTDEVR